MFKFAVQQAVKNLCGEVIKVEISTSCFKNICILKYKIDSIHLANMFICYM